MKKIKLKESDLRRIVRRVINEQTTNGEHWLAHTCGGNSSSMLCIPSSFGVSPGDTIRLGDNVTDPTSPLPHSGVINRNWFINIGMANVGACDATNWDVSAFNGSCTQCCDSTTWSSVQGGNTPQGACWDACSATQAGSCNPSAFSNHANFTSNFTNTVTNHNNPCNFLNQKITQFTNNLQGTGQGGYQNVQNCKLDLANQLHSQNNC